MGNLRHVLSFESLIASRSGKLEREIEYTFYVHLKDLAELEKAAEIEEHEQWRIPIETDKPFKMRIRKINGRIYTEATKFKIKGMPGTQEVESQITQDQYEHYLHVAFDGYKKTRYCFPIPGKDLKWEVDVFMDQTGNKHPWVKVDLEVDDPNMDVPEFPLDYDQFILDNGPKQTMEEMRFVRSLWDREWSRLDPVDTATLGKQDDV